jgi:hypothetical protein
MSIATLIQEVSSEMGSRAAELGIKLEVQEPENATPNINADSDRINKF